MNRTDHLLTILDEECHEVGQRTTKALRFGLDEVQEGQSMTNAERIMVEMADLIAVYDMLELPWPGDDRIAAKKERVEHFLEYSKSIGRLDGHGAPVPSCCARSLMEQPDHVETGIFACKVCRRQYVFVESAGVFVPTNKSDTGEEASSHGCGAESPVSGVLAWCVNCARAMRWPECPPGTKPPDGGTWWWLADQGSPAAYVQVHFDGGSGVKWNPAEDYNQAMMMRDAVPKYNRDSFIDKLLRAQKMSFDHATAQKMRIVALSTAFRIADAAKSVLWDDAAPMGDGCVD